MVAVVVLTSLPPPATAQSDEEKARSQLQELQRDIKRINREIASASARRNSLQKQLRQADLELGKLQRSLADNRRTIAASCARWSSVAVHWSSPASVSRSASPPS